MVSRLWLQDAASLAMDALLARLDLEHGARPFFWVDLREQPPQAHHSSWDYCDIAGRFVDALPLAREITGRTDAAGIEAELRRFLWRQQDRETGLFMSPDTELPDGEATKYTPDDRDRAGQGHADMFAQRGPLLAMATLLAMGDESVRSRANRMVAGLSAIAERHGDELCFPAYRWARDLRSEWRAGHNVPERWLGYRYALLTGLARYVELTDDPTATDLAVGLARWYMRHGDVPPDGRFRANTHSGGVLPTAVGIARLGLHTGDREMIDWAHRVYAWVREQTPDFGFLLDGLGLEGPFSTTCETCGLADLIHLGVLLSEARVGDYWDDVERTVRNQLIENQYADEDALRRALPGISDRVLAMLHGGFECAASPNGLLLYDGAEACCIGGGVRALYIAWRASIDENGDWTRVRMGLTRSTPFVDVVGHEPWEGRIDVRLRSPGRVLVRVPDHASIDGARALVDGRDVAPRRLGRYVVLDDLRPGQVVSLRYPLSERRCSYEVVGMGYEADWRGHTVVEMRPAGTRYPTYQRRHSATADRGSSSNPWPLAAPESASALW